MKNSWKEVLKIIMIFFGYCINDLYKIVIVFIKFVYGLYLILKFY